MTDQALLDKVLAFAPGKVAVEEYVNTYPALRVEADALHDLARFLKENEETDFDYLMCLSGVDWGANLGVVYHLRSTRHGHVLVLKTQTPERITPTIDTISDLWVGAEFHEREVYDMFGIRFTNHPDMRRIFMSDKWMGFPLRKDYQASNPLHLETEGAYEDEGIRKLASGKGKDETFIINFGPQHPSTHGVLRLVITLEGENVDQVQPHCGYIHRGIEKMCEHLTYQQIVHLTDRMDYLSAHINNEAVCLCVEKALQVEVPLRAQYIRTIMDELTRVASHLLFWTSFGMDLGATTCFFYSMRERDHILDIFEETCGARLVLSYVCPGGVMYDLHPNFQRRVKDFIREMRRRLPEYHRLLSGNVIFQGRSRNIGVLSHENAVSFGVTGPSGRASGWHCDVRKQDPYHVYSQVDFQEAIRTEGDVFARYMLRMDEIETSLNIIEQLIDQIPSGDFAAKMKPVIRVPEGEYYQRVETARGELGVWLVSQGDKFPYRLKFRSPGFSTLAALPHLCHGFKIADLIAISGSLDFVIPDIDR
jgi:NADH-quinone oxidoreductase subunit C/D